MKFEDILVEIGSFGIFQKVLCFILIPITTGLVGLTYYTQIFILSTPAHICKQNFVNNVSSAYSENISSVSDREFQKGTFACNQFHENNIFNDFEDNSTTFAFADQDCKNGWEYDSKTIFPTITSENNWVCDESWKPYFIVTCFWIGNVIGAWIFGVLSDKFGRRPVIAASLLLYGSAGISSVFVADYFYIFLTLRILVGSAHHTVSHLPFILVMEYCGIRSRIIPLFTLMATYTVFSILAPLLAIAMWDWKSLAIATSLPSLFLPLLYRWLPESPSWMIAKGKLSEAIHQLEKVSKINKTPKSKEYLLEKVSLINPQEQSDDESKSKSDDTSLIKILKYPRLRINVVVVLFVWMISCLCYYGHCQNTVHLGSDIFKSFLLGAAIEIPAWSVPFLMQKFGRKVTLIVSYLLSGSAGVIYAVMPIEYDKGKLAFALLGRMFITGAYCITLQYGPEIFPTIVRGRGVAMSETLGGVAVFISPLIVYLAEFQASLPLIVFSILSVIGGLATIILPETKGKALPQTMPQAEIFAKNASSSFCCVIRKRNSMEEETF